MIDGPSGEMDIEAVLDRFRQWLESARDETEALASLADADANGEPAGDRAEFGLIELVGAFTALRHEVKLQTKSGRGVIEQAEAMVAGLVRAIEHFRSVEPKEEQAAWSAGRPIAEALGDLDEAMARGRREIERIRARLEEDAMTALLAAIDAGFRRRWWPARWRLRVYYREIRSLIEAGGWLHRDRLDAILEGYGLIQSRLARVMAAERVERIVCEGRPVDPERMVVLEVVDDPDLAPGTVVKEVRSGYAWKGRLLRYAEVQAASAASGARLALADDEASVFAGPDDEFDPDPDDLDIDIGPDGHDRHRDG